MSRRQGSAIGHFIPELTHLGIDIPDPIQPADAEMQPERLKADYGGQLGFHGGIDMQNLQPKGTQAQVVSEARRSREILEDGWKIFDDSGAPFPA